MDRLDLFVAYQARLLEHSDPSCLPRNPRQLPASHTLGRLARHLLVLGIELRAELPDPHRFLETAAWATIEVAQLIRPDELTPRKALDHLAHHQCERLEVDDWTTRSPEAHLARAFWQLSGLGLEVLSDGPGDGQLEEHAADLANYLLFAVMTSGAWELTFPTDSAIHLDSLTRASSGEAPTYTTAFPPPESTAGGS
jgi:hypothetical protein